jgi:hypothetical protein
MDAQNPVAIDVYNPATIDRQMVPASVDHVRMDWLLEAAVVLVVPLQSVVD